MVTRVTTITVMNGGSNEKSEKAERLLNLTLALLNTRVPLTKQQIFQNVAGYSGKTEAMERMFERDKDELREIGINIHVLPIDPLFDDELGYRILPSEYFLPEIPLSREESIWLSIAANLIRENQQDDLSQRALQKLLTRSDTPIDEIFDLNSQYQIQVDLNEALLQLWRAIKNKSNIRFSYLSNSAPGTLSNRTVSPYLITSRFTNWYLVARDLQDEKIKTFRIDRMTQITGGNKTAYVVSDFAADIQPILDKFKGDTIEKVIIKTDSQLSLDHRLIRKASSSQNSDGSLLLTLNNVDEDDISEIVLWAGPLVEVLAPESLRERIRNSLANALEAHT